LGPRELKRANDKKENPQTTRERERGVQEGRSLAGKEELNLKEGKLLMIWGEPRKEGGSLKGGRRGGN